MPILHIPVNNVHRQTLTARLGGDEVRLTIWRQPRGGWFASAEIGSDTLVSGKRLQPNVALLSPVHGIAGDLMCLPLRAGNISGLGEEPWGRTHQLIWIDDETADA